MAEFDVGLVIAVPMAGHLGAFEVADNPTKAIRVQMETLGWNRGFFTNRRGSTEYVVSAVKLAANARFPVRRRTA